MSDTQDWHDIIARIKDWVVSERLTDDDRPEPDVAMDAIAWANAEAATHHPSPSVVAPSGDGCIAFEWQDEDDRTVRMLEFDGVGEAIRTRCEGGKVIDKARVQIREGMNTEPASPDGGGVVGEEG